MFGSVCSGRPVQSAEQVDTNKYVINIENGNKISHVAIFLLPNFELDPGFAALIYFQLPNHDFNLLGSISSSKPSAIFRLHNNNQTQNASQNILDDIEMDTEDSSSPASSGSAADPLNNITVGISIEPLSEAEKQLMAMRETQSNSKPKLLPISSHTYTSTPITNPTSTAILANKIVKHAYNYLTGFVDDQGKVSIKFFDSWWEKFRARLQNDPKFLDAQD